jgi:hypothetical protein
MPIWRNKQEKACPVVGRAFCNGPERGPFGRYLILIKRSDVAPHLGQILGGATPSTIKPQTVHCHLVTFFIVPSLFLSGSWFTSLLFSFHPEMALFPNLCVNPYACVCGVDCYASVQALDFLDLGEDCSFPL